MNLKNRMIVEDYRNSKEKYAIIGDIVHSKLKDIISNAGIKIVAIEHRIKSENSLIGKLEKQGESYQKLGDIQDILGERVICYFSDDVDKIGELIEKNFNVNHNRSKDKRTLLNANTFGYQSLHFTCCLLPSNEYPEEYCKVLLEIQVRTNLQHTWAQIEHDLGYKNEFGIPRSIQRTLAGIASLLEIADNEFIRARDGKNKYTQDTREKITNDEANDLPINSITLQEYIIHNKLMKEFLDNLSNETNSEIYVVSSEAYVDQFKALGIETLGQLSEFRNNNSDLAIKLAKNALSKTSLDVISSNVALKYLCRAELINKNYSKEDIVNFLNISLANEEKAKQQAKHLKNQADLINAK